MKQDHDDAGALTTGVDEVLEHLQRGHSDLLLGHLQPSQQERNHTIRVALGWGLKVKR